MVESVLHWYNWSEMEWDLHIKKMDHKNKGFNDKKTRWQLKTHENKTELDIPMVAGLKIYKYG